VRALTWHGRHDVRVRDVPEPRIENPRDAVVRVTSTAICGSDLHLYDGVIPTMRPGDVLGHEFMGEVVEVGPGVANLAVGDRVLVPFPIACGGCFHCRRGEVSLCDNSNPTPGFAELLYGASPAGLFGYSHMLGGYPGGQAEYVRVPYADFGPLRVEHESRPEGMSDQKLLFLTDILPTGWQAALQCRIEPGDVVAVWGAGPVGQFAIRSALLQGAAQVIAIDRSRGRLELAERAGGVVGLDYHETKVFDALRDMTGGRGPDACIDAVGLESHGLGIDALYDRAKQALHLATDRGHALRQAIHACRKGGTVSIPGVYGGFLDKFPIGAVFAKGLTLRCGQTNVHAHLGTLLELVTHGTLDPSEIISHELSLEDAPRAYELFRDEIDLCTKVVLHPN
jgi:threonine dehydrogenase-like Zn-dependent dehydrogenase